MTIHSHVADCDSLPERELKKKYSLTYQSFRGLQTRRHSLGRTVAPELRTFTEFLRVLGPRPSRDYTLDRIDSSDPEYAAGKVRWADKLTQSRNRRVVKLMTDACGVTKPLTEWADELGVPASTLHARLRRGFSDVEALSGRRGEASTARGMTVAGFWPPGEEAAWTEYYLNCSRVEFCEAEPPEAFLLRICSERVTFAQRRVDQLLGGLTAAEASRECDSELREAFDELGKWQERNRYAQAICPQYRRAASRQNYLKERQRALVKSASRWKT